MAITRSAAELAEKWSTRLQGAGNEIRAGVNAVQENPMQKAVAQQAKMRANLLNAIDSGKWAERTQAVTLSQWKEAMINKGVDRITQGAAQGKSKMQSYLSEAIPVMNTISAEIDAMPSQNIQDSINRAAHWMRKMQEFSDNR